jgi:two-component system OmpR family sensor kinase
MQTLNFRQRLVLIHLAVISIIVLLTAVAAYWGLSRSVHGQLDGALLALGETEIAMLTIQPDQAIRIHEMPPGPTPPSFARLDRLVQIISANGEVLAHSSNLGASRLPTPPELLARLANGETVFETLPHFGEEPMRMMSMPVDARGARLAVQVAGSLDDVLNVLDSATLLFIAMALTLLIAVGITGVWVTQRAFQTINDIVHQAQSISESNLSQRLPPSSTNDEIGNLVDTLNELMERLEKAFESQRRFTADASHELRSPLSRLRTEIEVTLRRQRDQNEYVDTLRSCLEEVERLTVLVDELILVARIDANQEQSPAEVISLAILAKEVIRRIEPVACERDVQIILESSPPVMAYAAPGPTDLVLANLLGNAVKFSPPGGRVTVELDIDGADALVKVRDTGPGINLDEHPHLFDRFYRGSIARASAVPGIGLGLALSQSIVHAYCGKIEASNAPDGGATFTVRLPLAKTPT